MVFEGLERSGNMVEQNYKRQESINLILIEFTHIKK